MIKYELIGPGSQFFTINDLGVIRVEETFTKFKFIQLGKRALACLYVSHIAIW